MIKNDSTKGASLKEMRKREQVEKDALLLTACELHASEKYGADKLANWRKINAAIWYMVITNEDGTIDKLAVMKPITRQVLSYASTKLNDDGLYTFLEECMRACWIEGDNELVDDDEYFIPASQQFNKIMDGKKANLLKG